METKPLNSLVLGISRFWALHCILVAASPPNPYRHRLAPLSCVTLRHFPLSASSREVLKQRTVSALWRDGLGPLGRRDGRLPGWHDGDGAAKGGWWDYRGLSLLHAYQDLDQPPRGGGAARRSDSMWFSGGGGAFWTAERRRGLVTVSFSQTLGGRASESDGHGPLGYRISPYL